MCMTLIDSHWSNLPCIPQINPTWSWAFHNLGLLVIYLFSVFLNQRYSRILVCCILFLWPLFVTWCQGNAVPLKWIGSVPTSYAFKDIEEDWRFTESPPVKPSGPFLFSLGMFVITATVSLLVIGLFRFCISSWFTLGRLYVSQNLWTFRLSILLMYN
jgi:hypothetical protein